ncbi:MAG TPA: hypothetical protein PK264_11915, partial [Hyphomicrobiaceae bacterium]|nr:hypothetical protein [Hyphomicrobiaceae bacterium]
MNFRAGIGASVRDLGSVGLTPIRQAWRKFAFLDIEHGADDGSVRARQLREIVILTPWMMLGALLNCGILLYHFWRPGDRLAIGLWSVLIAGAAGYTL